MTRLFDIPVNPVSMCQGPGTGCLPTSQSLEVTCSLRIQVIHHLCEDGQGWRATSLHDKEDCGGGDGKCA